VTLVIRAAISALAFGPPEQITVTILAGLSDANWQVREAAALLARKINATGAVASLIEALSDDAWQVSGKAALALGKLQATEAVAALGKVLAHPVSNLRKDVATALGDIGHADALPFLEQAADDLDPDVCKIARWSIQRHRKPSIS
jgi:HEAT repeat protein